MFQKSRVLAEGLAKLNEIVESFDECLKLINVLDTVITTREGDLDSNFLTWAVCKGFAERVYGEQEARQIIIDGWDGQVVEFFNAFWQKPNSETLQRMAATRWANSMEGVSDLRKFWGLRPSEANTDELVAFSNTLPLDSATHMSGSEYVVPMAVLVNAQQADIGKLRLRQASGKAGRLSEGESTVAMLKKRGAFGSDDPMIQDLVERERKYQQEHKYRD